MEILPPFPEEVELSAHIKITIQNFQSNGLSIPRRRGLYTLETQPLFHKESNELSGS